MDFKFTKSDFPALSNHSKKIPTSSTWVKPIDKDKIKHIDTLSRKNVEDSLVRLPKELDSHYFNRLMHIFNKTTRKDLYHVYIVINNNRRFRVIARNDIIAKFLCQYHDYKNMGITRTHEINEYREYVYDRINEDEILYDNVMRLVDYNTFQLNTAVDIYCKSMNAIPEVKHAYWFDEKTLCVKTDVIYESLEKIIL
jgi:hypothetical protein